MTSQVNCLDRPNFNRSAATTRLDEQTSNSSGKVHATIVSSGMLALTQAVSMNAASMKASSSSRHRVDSQHSPSSSNHNSSSSLDVMGVPVSICSEKVLPAPVSTEMRALTQPVSEEPSSSSRRMVDLIHSPPSSNHSSRSSAAMMDVPYRVSSDNTHPSAISTEMRALTQAAWMEPSSSRSRMIDPLSSSSSLMSVESANDRFEIVYTATVLVGPLSQGPAAASSSSSYDASTSINKAKALVLIDKERVVINANVDLALTKLLGMDTNNSVALASRGHLNKLHGNNDSALADLNSSLTIKRDNIYALEVRGLVHASRGDATSSLKDLDRCLKIFGDNTSALRSLAEVHLANGNAHTALDNLNKALVVDGKDAWTLCRRGDVHRHLGKYKAALEDVDKALRIDVKHAKAWSVRGNTHRKQENYHWALIDLNKSLALKPNCHETMEIRSCVYKQKGDFGLALLDLFKFTSNFRFQVQIAEVLKLALGTTSFPSASNRLEPFFQELLGFHRQLATAATPFHFSFSPVDKILFNQLQPSQAVAAITQYEHVYKLLIALQQLDENRAHICKLDNKKKYLENIGAQYAYALSGIFLNSEVSPGVFDPIGQFIETMMAAYAKAKAQGKLLNFFVVAFNQRAVTFTDKSKILTDFAMTLCS